MALRQTRGMDTHEGPNPGAVLFDIDGTLVDSNYLHVTAWIRAFAGAGHPVDSWRIHRAIGMDGSKLVGELLGEDAAELGDQVKELHSEHYQKASDLLRPFASARDLLADLVGRDLHVVLATSAPPEELKLLRAALDVDDLTSFVTSSDDVDVAKPEPDLLQVALDEVGVAPHRAAMVGDAEWDMRAAVEAGVAAIGVLTGGLSRSELHDAGASEVYADVADLRANLDRSTLARLWA